MLLARHQRELDVFLDLRRISDLGDEVKCPSRKIAVLEADHFPKGVMCAAISDDKHVLVNCTNDWNLWFTKLVDKERNVSNGVAIGRL